MFCSIVECTQCKYSDFFVTFPPRHGRVVKYSFRLKFLFTIEAGIFWIFSALENEFSCQKSVVVYVRGYINENVIDQTNLLEQQVEDRLINGRL